MFRLLNQMPYTSFLRTAIRSADCSNIHMPYAPYKLSFFFFKYICLYSF